MQVRAARLAAIGCWILACTAEEAPVPVAPATESAAPDTPVTNQGWSDAQRIVFYRTPQGTAFYRYSWFMALEQAGLPGSRFADPDFISRFGFLKDDLPGNEDGLPVGIAVDRDFVHPRTPEGPPVAVVGFTCAACHTGEIHYRGEVMRIEGGPAMIDLAAFRSALAAATAAVLEPEAFSRFASRVLAEGAGEAERQALREEFQRFAVQRAQEQKQMREQAPEDPAEGWGRLAALERIGNTVLSPNASIPENLVPVDAPASFPPLWGTPWFLWVQYNASILQPLARNVGEALGVNAPVDLATFESTVRVDDLGRLEELIAGPEFGKGLMAPRWREDILPPLDTQRVDHGKRLYEELCQECHLTPIREPSMQQQATPEWVKPEGSNRRYLALVEKPVVAMGTDPTVAENFARRRADLSAFGLGRDVSVAEALRLVTTRVPEVWFERNETPPSRRAELVGDRPNVVRDLVAGQPVYRARPLDGVWATAPYLHNGSIPNLYELLSPQAERSTRFCVGGREFDPVKVGLEPVCRGSATTEIDTTRKGNWNRGHEFTGDGTLRQNGVLGRGLSDEERYAVIEFLKTL